VGIKTRDSYSTGLERCFDSCKCPKCRKEKRMKVTDFNTKVTHLEGLSHSLSVAQVAEVVRIINKLTKGLLYNLIKSGLIDKK